MCVLNTHVHAFTCVKARRTDNLVYAFKDMQVTGMVEVHIVHGGSNASWGYRDWQGLDHKGPYVLG